MKMAFEEWLRQTCFKAPPIYAKDLALSAWDHQQARIDALEKELGRVREQTICETTGFVFSYCCRAIDTGVDIRELEIPMVLEKVLAALLEAEK